MSESSINVSRKQSGVWVIRVNGNQVAQYATGEDIQAELVVLAAQHLAAHYAAKSIDFTMNPDDMEHIKRVGLKKPKLIRMPH